MNSSLVLPIIAKTVVVAVGVLMFFSKVKIAFFMLKEPWYSK